MVTLLFIGFGFFCIFLQTSFLLNHLVSPFKPDLTIPLTVYVGLSRQPVWGGLYVLGIGYVMDVLSGGILGLYIFVRVFMFFLVQILKKNFFLENNFLLSVVILLFFLIEGFLISLGYGLVGEKFVGMVTLLKTCGVQGFFSLFLWFLMFPGLSKIERIAKNF